MSVLVLYEIDNVVVRSYSRSQICRDEDMLGVKGNFVATCHCTSLDVYSSLWKGVCVGVGSVIGFVCARPCLTAQHTGQTVDYEKLVFVVCQIAVHWFPPHLPIHIISQIKIYEDVNFEY